MSDKVTVQVDRTDAEWLRDNPGYVSAYSLNSRAGSVLRAAIAALPPEEPTKRGAVVGIAHRLFVRRAIHDDPWWHEVGDDSGAWLWNDLLKVGTPVVHFEGVTS